MKTLALQENRRKVAPTLKSTPPKSPQPHTEKHAPKNPQPWLLHLFPGDLLLGELRLFLPEEKTTQCQAQGHNVAWGFHFTKTISHLQAKGRAPGHL